MSISGEHPESDLRLALPAGRHGAAISRMHTPADGRHAGDDRS
jgi:hypothetical protein